MGFDMTLLLPKKNYALITFVYLYYCIIENHAIQHIKTIQNYLELMKFLKVYETKKIQTSNKMSSKSQALVVRTGLSSSELKSS